LSNFEAPVTTLVAPSSIQIDHDYARPEMQPIVFKRKQDEKNPQQW